MCVGGDLYTQPPSRKLLAGFVVFAMARVKEVTGMVNPGILNQPSAEAPKLARSGIVRQNNLKADQPSKPARSWAQTLTQSPER